MKKKPQPICDDDRRFITHFLTEDKVIIMTIQQAFTFLLKEIRRVDADLTRLHEEVNGYPQ
jgi:hypothetical protein